MKEVPVWLEMIIDWGTCAVTGVEKHHAWNEMISAVYRQVEIRHVYVPWSCVCTCISCKTWSVRGCRTVENCFTLGTHAWHIESAREILLAEFNWQLLSCKRPSRHAVECYYLCFVTWWSWGSSKGLKRARVHQSQWCVFIKRKCWILRLRNVWSQTAWLK